jgi:hypothetical protein
VTRRGRILLVGVAAALLVTTGTGAFSATVADRGVTVAVVDDDSAFLGFEQSALPNGSTANLTVTMTVTNRFPETDLETVAIEVSGSQRELVDGGSLGPGDSVTRTWADVPCGDPILVTAAGGGVDVTLNRSVDCS